MRSDQVHAKWLLEGLYLLSAGSNECIQHQILSHCGKIQCTHNVSNIWRQLSQSLYQYAPSKRLQRQLGAIKNVKHCQWEVSFEKTIPFKKILVYDDKNWDSVYVSNRDR